VGFGDRTTGSIPKDHQRRVAAGDVIFDEGDPGDRLFVIQSGEIELSRDGPGGHRVVARLGAGDFFGELGVVLGERCAARAVAVKNSTLLELDRQTLEAMCLAQPEIAIRMIRVLVSRLIEAERRLAALGVDDLLRPMVRALVRRAEPADGGGMRIPLTLRGLAEEAGLSLLEAHRALHQLLDRKLVHLVEDTLLAPNLEALSACLDAPDPVSVH
jgi:CRP/FNR family cyclic AMP-dependent transcriptional regulator